MALIMYQALNMTSWGFGTYGLLGQYEPDEIERARLLPTPGFMLRSLRRCFVSRRSIDSCIFIFPSANVNE